MKTSGTTDAVLPLTKKQKTACNIVMGVLLILAGVVLVLAGCGVIDVSVRRMAAPTILFSFGLAVALSAIIAKNSLSMWIAGVILACGLTSLLELVTTATYANLFPMYIAAPGVGCLFAIVFSEAKFPQVKAMGFFGGLAGVFSLGSSGACSWGLTAGLVAGFAGLCVILYALDVYLKKDNDNA